MLYGICLLCGTFYTNRVVWQLICECVCSRIQETQQFPVIACVANQLLDKTMKYAKDTDLTSTTLNKIYWGRDIKSDVKLQKTKLVYVGNTESTMGCRNL